MLPEECGDENGYVYEVQWTKCDFVILTYVNFFDCAHATMYIDSTVSNPSLPSTPCHYRPNKIPRGTEPGAIM